MSKKNRDACQGIDHERLLCELQSPDEAVRARAVRSLCPCHAGWELFEQHVVAVLRLEKDQSPAVRANALHVFEDAARMISVGDPAYRHQLALEKTRGKRPSRFRPDEKKRKPKRRGRSGLRLF